MQGDPRPDELVGADESPAARREGSAPRRKDGGVDGSPALGYGSKVETAQGDTNAPDAEAAVRPARPWRPLAGVRVLDLSRLLPGGFATMVLADLGAAVDKVEPPFGGDYLRALPPHVDGLNAAFRVLHRGKRSVAIDLKREEGRAVLLDLLPRYDVLLESFRPGVLSSWGLGHETLLERHPSLVLCALSGYGQQGPLSGRAGHDLNFLARSGVLGAVWDEESEPPPPPPMQAADVGGALYAVAGVLAALAERERTGRGRLLDVSLCEASAGFGLLALAFAWAAPSFGARAMLSGGLAPYGVYRTADGGAVALAALEPKFWRRFCEASGFEGSMEDLLPGPHQASLKERLRAHFALRDRAEWERLAEEADCCLEPVLRPEESPTDRQHAARGLFTPSGTGMPRLATPLGAPAAGEAPRLGEHTEAVLREAGISPEQMERLRRAGVLGGPRGA